MTRPQVFDYTVVLQAAMRLFWQYGYEATSLADLQRVTKLSKSSLYATFGSKHGLFIAAFDAYREARRRDRMQRLTLSPARPQIEWFFRTIVADVTQPDLLGRGCMTVNQAVDLAPHDPMIRQRVIDDLQELQDRLCQAIQRGQAEGDISRQRTPDCLARLFMASFSHINIMARLDMPRVYFESFLSDVLALLH
ncbi:MULTISPECIES: TetR/AcrR family transcriptional regulator [unclassified Saccharibacter]|uniref:TetR/AcrR family transcriptional regulator n=1 Tax=unclassified Saccharibacter TaxID=2648722 RepID=UPI0013228307|nr:MULTISPECIES: TetR/AcrR family transcriptional regulator [unclassified Saccharibacter]MXV36912.1 TetR family transcriptional regulator [Saccharibacter sp. EH611]MXV58598.1 TetR family transcriptional regulator [Saccharibacter sp. EH70]MXV66104.1 TetR family transcriptional regulator [Saccharibacter sp. EH60]